MRQWLKMAEDWMRMVRGKSKADQNAAAFDELEAEKGTRQKNSILLIDFFRPLTQDLWLR